MAKYDMMKLEVAIGALVVLFVIASVLSVTWLIVGGESSREMVNDCERLDCIDWQADSEPNTNITFTVTNAWEN